MLERILKKQVLSCFCDSLQSHFAKKKKKALESTSKRNHHRDEFHHSRGFVKGLKCSWFLELKKKSLSFLMSHSQNTRAGASEVPSTAWLVLHLLGKAVPVCGSSKGVAGSPLLHLFLRLEKFIQPVLFFVFLNCGSKMKFKYFFFGVFDYDVGVDLITLQKEGCCCLVHIISH